MVTFFKANVAGLVASLADFLITISLVTLFKVNPLEATITGTVSGGIINFLIGRHWAFDATEANAYRQAYKYFLVWAGNLLLNVSSMYLFSKYTNTHYIIAKLATSVLVAYGYNYPLQKKYVFKRNWINNEY
ncbi:GtrA family protein [Parasediminibacterium sp. JCM 36343]|uniref:GtrA family protein n=1 Tax=Parasediminibacterium sp. JCM 36343 TaxID=3374279 RepID=UPI00397A59A9